MPAKTADLLAKKEGIEVLDVPGTLHFTFPMRVDMAPFKDNNDLRLALKYAFDREDALKTILRGYGALGRRPSDLARQPLLRLRMIPQRPYDPDRAKFHLKKAGMEGFKN